MSILKHNNVDKRIKIEDFMGYLKEDVFEEDVLGALGDLEEDEPITIDEAMFSRALIRYLTAFEEVVESYGGRATASLRYGQNDEGVIGYFLEGKRIMMFHLLFETPRV